MLLLLLLLLALPLWAQEAAPPQGPGHILYADSKDAPAVLKAWRAVVLKKPGFNSPLAIRPPAQGWIALAVKALEPLPPEAASDAAKALSLQLHTHVLHMAVTKDDRAWYFLYADGKQVDRYCSNPGLPGEVSHDVLRDWAGKPDVLLPLCRGTPISKTRSEVSLTDLNALLYYYYPEMKLKKPASWRSPGDLMRLLSQVLGVPQPPAPYQSLAGLPGWKRL